MTPVRNFNISKSAQRIETTETITCRKVLKYLLTFDKESKRKPLNLIPAGNFIKNNNIYDFRVKISFIHAYV